MRGKESGIVMDKQNLSDLILAERQAVGHHRSTLSQEAGREVSIEEALADWFEHHAVKWREKRQAAYLAMQREEINKHKWIESEKADRDLGSAAVMDWIGRYSAAWREWFDEEFDDVDLSGVEDAR